MNLYEFAANNPFLTWCLAWGIWAVPLIIVLPIAQVRKAFRDRSRARNIAKHGWPNNPFMDGDGLVAYPPKAEREEA